MSFLKRLFRGGDTSESMRITPYEVIPPRQMSPPEREAPATPGPKTDKDFFDLGMKIYRRGQPKHNPNAIRASDYSLNEAQGREAYSFFSKCLEINPDHTEALLMKARCVYDLGDNTAYGSALLDVEQVLGTDARNARAHHIRGLLLYRLKSTELDRNSRLNEVIHSFRLALELDPNYIDDLGSAWAFGTPSNERFRSEIAALEAEQLELQTERLDGDTSVSPPPSIAPDRGINPDRGFAAADRVALSPPNPPPITVSPQKTGDQLSILKQLCGAYTRNDFAQIQRLEPLATEIGRELDRQGGITEMRRVYSSLGGIPGTRTLDMHWDGIGDWRG